MNTSRSLEAVAVIQQELERLNAELELRVEERTQELLSANRELEAFSFSVSHDLRAPLRAIEGFSAELLRSYAPKLDDRGQHYLIRIQAAAKRMASLIDDLLDLSRLTRDAMVAEPVNLSQLVRTIGDELAQLEPSRRVELIVEDGAEARGDARLLRIALENLLRNAWKFTSKVATPKVEFGKTTSNGLPAFFLRDNGAGFDMSFAQHLFGVFQRLHHEKDFPGTGVGLATVQRVIRRHGGDVWAEGAIGQGATFYFTIPSRTASV